MSLPAGWTVVRKLPERDEISSHNSTITTHLVLKECEIVCSEDPLETDYSGIITPISQSTILENIQKACGKEQRNVELSLGKKSAWFLRDTVTGLLVGVGFDPCFVVWTKYIAYDDTIPDDVKRRLPELVHSFMAPPPPRRSKRLVQKKSAS